MEWSVQKVDACTCNMKKKKKPGIDDEEEKMKRGRRVERRRDHRRCAIQRLLPAVTAMAPMAIT